MTANQRIEAIFWDLDGTLADTHPLIHRCVDETFREFFGRGYELGLWEQSVGHPLTVVLQAGFDAYDIACDDMLPAILFYRERLKSYEAEVRAFPGAIEAVEALSRSGVRQVVVTTKFGEAAVRHLATLGLSDIFEAVITGDHCKHYKPDPEPFCRALEALDLPPERCLMVGDSAADVIGSRAAGVRSVAALWGTLDREAVNAARPDFTATKPGEVVSIWEGHKD